jgi:hypothetical protein
MNKFIVILSLLYPLFFASALHIAHVALREMRLMRVIYAGFYALMVVFGGVALYQIATTGKSDEALRLHIASFGLTLLMYIATKLDERPAPDSDESW